MELGHATSRVLWRATIIATLIDVPLLFLVARWISSELFYKLKWYLVGAAFVVYAVLWGTFGSVYYWDAVYKEIFPAWFRWLLPLVYGLLFGACLLACEHSHDQMAGDMVQPIWRLDVHTWS
jgi:hypothetical protein